jgi:hypothetical protein
MKRSSRESLHRARRSQAGKGSSQRRCPSSPLHGDWWWVAPVDFLPRRWLGRHLGTSVTILDQAAELGWVCFGLSMAVGCNEGSEAIFMFKGLLGGEFL